MKNPKEIGIVFFGSPEFAAAQMEHLIDEGYRILAAVTAVDKPAGRGRKIRFSEVKEKALKHQIPLLQPEKLKDPFFLDRLCQLQADLFVVIAFRMLPEQIWRMPPLGTFNLHASLLPQYRGAAPIHRAIMNGEQMSGLTTFFLNERIDSGDILLQERMHISEDETAGMLHDRMVKTAKILVERTIKLVSGENVKVVSQKQENRLLHTAPKIFRADCRINWDRPGRVIHNFVRGLSPYPTAYTEVSKDGGKKTELKIFRGKYEKQERSEKDVFRLLTDNRSYLKVALKDGFFHLLEVQIAGRRIMEISEFLRGNPFHGNWTVS